MERFYGLSDIDSVVTDFDPNTGQTSQAATDRANLSGLPTDPDGQQHQEHEEEVESSNANRDGDQQEALADGTARETTAASNKDLLEAMKVMGDQVAVMAQLFMPLVNSSVGQATPVILTSYLDPDVLWEPGGSPFDPQILSGPGGPKGRLWSPEASLDLEVTFRIRRSFGNPEVPSDPETQRSFGNPEVPSDPAVVFRTRRSFVNPEVPSDPEVVFRTRWSFGNQEVPSGPGDCLQGAWPEQMVDLPICCSEHDVSMWFSEHGGTPLMSWRSWPEPGSRVVDVRNLALAAVELMSSGHGRRGPPLFRSYVLEYFLFLSDLGGFLLVQAGTLFKRRFPFILRQDKSLGLEARPRPGGGDPDPGAGTQIWGHGPGSRRGEPRTRRQGPDPGAGTWMPEGGTRDLGAGTWKPELGVISSWNIFPQQTSSRSMGHQTPLSIVLGCTCGRSERIRSLIGDISPGEWAIILDPMQRRGRHASMGICLVSSCTLDSDDLEDEMLPPWWGLVGVGRREDFRLHFWRLSSSMNRVEECMGQDPKILRGRILARLRIRGMRRFNKTRRPKLRILMLDGLSSWNPEARWTFVLEPGGWMDSRPGTRRLDGLSSWNPEAVG
ncbi:hypothetical protein DY000_02016091 [Brassica cretica]|uniref:Uncharacterized protein n=1 Tax=Brassica cretica TaxID=69181 RepID=A0ABQ7D326_BRACR|nr:hypothetical protein DY000_02016091 [Brassica cretica]